MGELGGQCWENIQKKLKAKNIRIFKGFYFTFFIIILVLNYSFSQNCELELTGFNQKSNVAYLGVDNFVKMKSDSLKLETNNGEIFFDRNRFQYRPKTLGKAIIYSTSTRNMTKKSKVDSCEVTVKYLPFTFEFGYTTTFHKSTIQIKKKHLLSDCFYMRSTNTNLSAQAIILGFTIKIERNKSNIIERTFNDYDKETRNTISRLFESLKKDDIIIIDKLKYMYIEEHIIENKRVKIVVN